MTKRRAVFLILAFIFIVTFIPVAVLDLNLLLFGEGFCIRKFVVNSTFVGIFLLWAGVLLFFYVRFDRAYRVTYMDGYLSAKPFGYSPALVAALFRFGHVDYVDLPAMIGYFLNRYYVYIVKEKVSNHEIALQPSNLPEGLPPHEQFLLRWLFDQAGEGSHLTGTHLAAIAADGEKAKAFVQVFVQWQDAVRKDAYDAGFFFNYAKTGKVGAIIGVMFCVAGIGLSYVFDRSAFFIFFFLGLILFGYCRGLSKRTREGQEQFELWMAYKRYLKDKLPDEPFGPEQAGAVMEALPYAVPLGVYSHMRETLQERMNEEHKPEMEALYQMMQLMEAQTDLIGQIWKKAEE